MSCDEISHTSQTSQSEATGILSEMVKICQFFVSSKQQTANFPSECQTKKKNWNSQEFKINE